jgi:hypothetical protein
MVKGSSEGCGCREGSLIASHHGYPSLEIVSGCSSYCGSCCNSYHGSFHDEGMGILSNFFHA